MTKFRIALLASAAALSAVTAFGVAGAATATRGPVEPAWVTTHDTVNPALVPHTVPMAAKDGAVVKDSRGKVKMHRSDVGLPPPSKAPTPPPSRR